MDKLLKEKISVIIPLYNSSSFMSKTIQSVLDQTYKNYDIILIDDCSQDDTQSIGLEYEHNYKNIIYYRLAENSGAAIARNKGMEISDSRYIAFLDSDDIWEKNKLEEQLAFMKKENAAFSFCSYDIIDDNNNILMNSFPIKKEVHYNELLKSTIIATPTVMIDRKIVGKLGMPNRRTGQDYAFWLLLLRNHIAYGLNKTLVHVCRRKLSLSKNKIQNILDVWEVQTINEGIKKYKVFINIIFYIYNVINNKTINMIKNKWRNKNDFI